MCGGEQLLGERSEWRVLLAQTMLEHARVVLEQSRAGADASPQGDLNGSRRKFVCSSFRTKV